MALRSLGWRMNSPANEMHLENAEINYDDSTPISIDAEFHSEIIEGVLKTAAEEVEAKSIKPGEVFNLSLDDVQADTGSLDLPVGLRMEADKYDLLCVSIGQTAILFQVCNPTRNEFNATDN
jgi:hypothetical protein